MSRVRFVALVLGALVAASLPAGATFPGKNGRVAYRAGANYIFLTGVGQLTFPGFLQSDFSPAFSPDGAQIAFVRQTPLQVGYFYEVMAVNTNGTNLRTIASSAAFPGLNALTSITEPAWTPDGHVSFIVRSGSAAQNGIWLDGVRIVAETFSTGQNWSPVGKQLVYACSFRKNALNQDMTDLCVYDAIKADIRQLRIDWSGRVSNGVGFPKWTRDGERIVFQMNAPDAGIYAV